MELVDPFHELVCVDSMPLEVSAVFVVHFCFMFSNAIGSEVLCGCIALTNM